MNNWQENVNGNYECDNFIIVCLKAGAATLFAVDEKGIKMPFIMTGTVTECMKHANDMEKSDET